MKINMLPAVLLMFAAAFVQTGCSEIRGCMDSYSDNYDPEATEDDDTCVPTRMKFVGDYDAHGNIIYRLDSMISADQVDLTITDETAESPDELILGVSNFDQPLYALNLLITSKYEFSIVNQSIGAFTFYGTGNINGRVLELNYTRIEEIEIEPDVFEYDTIQLSLYGLQEIVE